MNLDGYEALPPNWWKYARLTGGKDDKSTLGEQDDRGYERQSGEDVFLVED